MGTGTSPLPEEITAAASPDEAVAALTFLEGRTVDVTVQVIQDCGEFLQFRAEAAGVNSYFWHRRSSVTKLHHPPAAPPP